MLRYTVEKDGECLADCKFEYLARAAARRESKETDSTVRVHFSPMGKSSRVIGAYHNGKDASADFAAEQ